MGWVKPTVVAADARRTRRLRQGSVRAPGGDESRVGVLTPHPGLPFWLGADETWRAVIPRLPRPHPRACVIAALPDTPVGRRSASRGVWCVSVSVSVRARVGKHTIAHNPPTRTHYPNVQPLILLDRHKATIFF
jgi:hypothetical protein